MARVHMLRPRVRQRVLIWLTVAGLLSSLAVAVRVPQAEAADPGLCTYPTTTTPNTSLSNRGFETGDLSCWSAAAADSVNVLDGDIASSAGVIAPTHGQWFARLGTPKDESQSQPKGVNSLTQQFELTDSSQTVTFDAHLFSWEHRSDRLTVSLTLPKPASGSVDIGLGPDLTTTCKTKGGSANCVLPVTAKENGQLLDRQGSITINLPASSGSVATVSIAVEGTQDNAFATWMYLDANSEPIVHASAKVPSGETLYEGAPIQLLDTSAAGDTTDPDGNEIVSWAWTVSSGGYTRTADVRAPWFVPPDQGDYDVSLTVTDEYGASASTSFSLNVTNAPPLVNALDVEVTDDQAPIPARGRFLDAGWTDDHTAALPGGTPMDCVDVSDTDPTPADPCSEDHVAGLGTGRVSAHLPAGATSGSLEVTDDSGAVGVDDFSVAYNASSQDRGESAETDPGGAVVHAGTSYLEYLSSPSDVDRRRVVLPTQASTDLRDATDVYPDLPVGSEVLVSLTDLPADYDLAVVTSQDAATAPFSLSPFSLSPFSLSPFSLSPFSLSSTETAPFSLSPIERAPFSLSPFSLSPFSLSGVGGDPYDVLHTTLATAPFSLSPFSLSPFSLSPFSLSPLSESGLQSGTSLLGGSDVSPAELGIADYLADGEQLAGYSVNRGAADESVLVRIDQPGTTVTVLVWSPTGVVAPVDPYRLDVEAAVPYSEVAALAGQGATCPPRTGLTPDGSTSPTVTSYGNGTLFVTSWDRLQDTTGATDSEIASLRSELASLAQRPEVGGTIVSLPSSVYDDWNADPCSVVEANAVTDQVRATIQAELAGATYHDVVLVGGDDVVPHRRVPGETAIGGERTYLSSSFVEPGTPLYASMLANANLTDDYYVDAEPTPFQGRALFVPDLPISRLVETPAQITAAIEAYVDADGQLIADSASVNTLALGHTFLWDGTARAAEAFATLGGDHVVNTAEGATWTAADLRADWLGIGASTPALDPTLSTIGAHFTHFATQSAKGFEDAATGGSADPWDEIVSTADVVSPDARSLAATLLFTVGCHAGLDVPNLAASSVSPGGGVDPSLDLPEAVSGIRTGVLVASTGYGIGETEGVAGTELLMALLAEELTAPGQRTVGEALLAAKHRYVNAQSAFSAYDEKSLIQTVLYGLPMFRVDVAGSPTPVVASAPAIDATATTTATPTTLGPYTFTPQTTPTGTYWSGDDGVEAVPGRPLQPLAIYPQETPMAGVLLTSGTYTEQVGVDPVFSRPSTEWERTVTEPQECLDRTWWPAVPVSLQRNDGGQSLVAVPGQFRCDSGGPPVTGTQRLFGQLGVELLPVIDPSDHTTPRVTGIDLRSTSDGVEATVNVADSSDISRVVVVALADGVVTSFEAPSGNPLTVVPGLPAGADLLFQVVDVNNNVTTVTAKGALVRAVGVSVTEDDADGYYVPGTPEAFTVNDSGGLVAPVTYLWTFGDGSTASTINDPTISHTFGGSSPDPVQVTVRVTDSAGATGTADLFLPRACDAVGDAATGTGTGDLVGCSGSATNAGTNSVVTLSVTTVGPLNTTNFQYRFLIDIDGDRQPDEKVTYGNGKWTGIKGAKGSVEGRTLTVTFPVKWTKLVPGQPFSWSAEVWGGVPGEQGAGFIDRLPDEPDWRSVTPS